MRQHVNLSEYGYHILCMDYHACGLFKNMSSFMGHIINNYYQSPDLFIINSFEEEYMLLKSCFNRFDCDTKQALPSDSDYYFLHKIMLGYVEKKLETLKREYASDITFKLSLPDALADSLFCQQDDEIEMFGPSSDFKRFSAPSYLKTKASYVKYLLESYARLTPYNRQCILYKDTFDTISHIEESFYSNNDTGNLKIPLYELRSFEEETGFERILVKPYRLTKSTETSSPELLCFTDQMHEGIRTHQFLPDSIPLSVIRSMKPAAKYLGSGKLTFNQQKDLDYKAENGFFESEIVISFTEEGFQDYLSDFSRKPHANPSAARLSFDNRILLSFQGDLSYLYSYFSSYGEDAIVIWPKDKLQAIEDVCKCTYYAYGEYATSASEWTLDTKSLENIMDFIKRLKARKISWEYAKEECRRLSQSNCIFGYYPFFIKRAAENEITEAYAEYADMLFDGIFVQRDYNLAGYYYTKSRDTLTISQKYNLASIYENGLCSGHSIAEGKKILLNRNETKEPIFDYKSPEGYTFHALRFTSASKNMRKRRLK